MKILALIPHYNHPKTIAQVARQMRQFELDVLIVDDGSTVSGCLNILAQLAQENGIFVVYRPTNGGKGAAVKTGGQYAKEHGYTHILQVDADGQHELADTPKFITVAQSTPEAVICGQPIYGADAPKSRLYGRKITDFWNVLHTWSFDIKDGMCGFRLYPIAAVMAVICQEYVGERMDFDTEILVRLHWRGTKFIWIQTPVKYAQDGVSHFNAWADNWRISKMHARLFCGMLWRRCRKIVKIGKAA